jgi:hypothetical protein
MIQAELPSITKQTDAGLLADIARHGTLWAQWDHLAEIDEDHPRIADISHETTVLARRIVVTPAHTVEGLDGKRRVVALEELESWDDLGLIETILQLDLDRIATVSP